MKYLVDDREEYFSKTDLNDELGFNIPIHRLREIGVEPDVECGSSFYFKKDRIVFIRRAIAEFLQVGEEGKIVASAHLFVLKVDGEPQSRAFFGIEKAGNAMAGNILAGLMERVKFRIFSAQGDEPVPPAGDDSGRDLQEEEAEVSRVQIDAPYVVSTTGSKFHKKQCVHVRNQAGSLAFNDLEAAITAGYSGAHCCFPGRPDLWNGEIVLKGDDEFVPTGRLHTILGLKVPVAALVSAGAPPDLRTNQGCYWLLSRVDEVRRAVAEMQLSRVSSDGRGGSD